MRHDEAEKNWQQEANRLFHPAQIEIQEETGQHQLDAELHSTERRRQQRKQSVDAARDRDRYRQNVVDYERASRTESGARAEQARGDLVTAAARREQLDDLIVG